MQLDGVCDEVKRTCLHFYQIQAQIKVYNAVFCDFVVWNGKVYTMSF